MKKKTKILIAIGSVLFVIFCICIGVVIYIKSCLKPTRQFLHGELCADGQSYCEVTPFVVDEGAYGLTTLQKLETEGIIKNADVVYYWNRILGGYSFYAGYYEIPIRIDNQETDLAHLLGWLSNPNNAHQDVVTIKLDEGDFANNFAKTIAEYIVLKDRPTADYDGKVNLLLEYWNNPDAIDALKADYPFITEDIKKNSRILLEGYLFPDTYEFFEYTTCEEVTRKILDRTLDIYEKYEDEFKNSKLSTHEIFTLASIVQWETGDAEDGKKVAGALLNRIDNPEFEGTGGKLQSTVTACYAFELTKIECDKVGDTEKYTQTYNEYNTYTIEGFPPGPVCNANEISIYAALNPDQESGYYFFVADMCNGGTAFARTYAQHNYNIDRYYLACSY